MNAPMIPTLMLSLIAALGGTRAEAAEPLAQTADATAREDAAPAWRSFATAYEAQVFARQVRMWGGIVFRVFYDPYAGWWVVEYA